MISFADFARVAREFGNQFRLRRHQAKRLARGPVALRRGFWRGDGRLFARTARDARRVHEMFYMLAAKDRDRSARKSVLRSAVRQALTAVLDIFTMFRVAGDRSGPTAVVVSRDGSLKYFDFSRKEVLSWISRKVAAQLCRSSERALFRYFATPRFELLEIGDSLEIANAGFVVSSACPSSTAQGGSGYLHRGRIRETGSHGLLKREALLPHTCIGAHSQARQYAAFDKICRIYAQYVSRESSAPRPELYASCFAQIYDCLAGSQRAQFAQREFCFRRFVETARTVEAHLDFNIGNFVGDLEELWLLDIADAGLRLPGTFDINNLMLNEVYEGRSVHLLERALEGACEHGLSKVLVATTGASSVQDLQWAVFANFVLRESDYVSVPLFGESRRALVTWHWRLFERSVPGWPFDAS